MSEIRADILDHLTLHCSGEAPVSSIGILGKFSKLYRLEADVVSAALDDLRHLGLIEISVGAVTLTPLAMRLSR